jgi:hypothetical protein
LVLAPTSRWARVTVGAWVTADSRCRWRWVRCAEPDSALPSTAIAGRGAEPVAPTCRVADVGVAAFGEVGADRGVQGIAVEGGQEAGEGGMGRGASTSGRVTADAELFQHLGGGALPPLGDLGDGPGAGDDCAGADQQQADQGIPPPATRTRVGYALEVGAQTAGVVRVEGIQFRQNAGTGEDAAAGTGPRCDLLA